MQFSREIKIGHPKLYNDSQFGVNGENNSLKIGRL